MNNLYRNMKISAILVLTLVLFAGMVTTASADPPKPDLAPTDITPPSSIVVDIPTTINATVNNTGTKDAAAFNVTLAVDGTIVDTLSVSNLDKDDSTTVSFTWTPATAGNHLLTVTADSEYVIDESDETNNNISLEVTAYTSGYMGGSLTTYAHDVVRGDLLYTTGNSTYRGSMESGETYTVEFNITDIPSGAAVKTARLYSYWSWSKDGDANMDVTFSGAIQTLDASYIDRKGYDKSDYPYGTYAYNVDLVGNGVHTATVTNTGSDTFSNYAMGLLVVYEDNGNEIEYWIDEGADIISAKYGVTPEQATTDAPFDGTVSLTDVESARLITVVPSGDKGLNTLLFNSYTESGIWNTTTIAVEERNVTSHITSTGNLAQLRDNEDFMMPSGVFLVLQRYYTPPTVSSGVTLGASIIPAVSIEVTPDTLNFGTLAPGQTSSELNLGISNTGACTVAVTADVSDTAGDLYVSGLLLNSGIWSSYSATVEKAGSVNAGAALEVPSGYTGVGTKEGTLILWAEKV